VSDDISAETLLKLRHHFGVYVRQY
jgi:hypothetical protein